MAYAEAKRVGTDAIPVIDIGALRDGSDPDSVARALHAASSGVGFLYVANHGIPETVIEAARTEAFAFFRGPADTRQAVAVSGAHRGWLGRGGAKMQDDAKPDLKESFIWGWQDANGLTPEDHPLRGPNRWPTAQPGLEAAAMAYLTAAHGVAHRLMEGFARGLGLAPGFFTATATRPLSRCSFVYYPAQPPEAGADQFGVGPHTDFGVLTVLAQDATGGLQVETAAGEWVHAPPIPGTLVVNVGDLLARWTAGAYRSTPHRVVNRSGQERLSLVLAFDPDPETRIDPAEVFGTAPDGAEPAITCGDYLLWRFGRAFAYRT